MLSMKKDSEKNLTR